MQPADARQHLRFDVARLRSAAVRLQGVDDELRALRGQLEQRARTLRDEANGEPAHGSADEGPLDATPIRNAQAQATAELARRAALGEVLRHSGAVSLVAAMAVSRWVAAILSSTHGRGGDGRRSTAKGHIDAGRLVHRMLATLRRGRGLRSGCGQLVCAVVVAELAPSELRDYLDEEIDDGLARALSARGVQDESGALAAASAALREGARLLERMADRAEPAVRDLLARADQVEEEVAQGLAQGARAYPWTGGAPSDGDA